MRPDNKPDIGLIEFTLKDAKGLEHRYEMTLMPAGAGMRVTFELSSILSGLLEGFEDVEDANLFALLAPVLKGMDPDHLTDLGKRLLATVDRNGSRMMGRDFDKAYRGNYTEMLLAMARVIQENRFVPLLDGFFSSETTEEP